MDVRRATLVCLLLAAALAAPACSASDNAPAAAAPTPSADSGVVDGDVAHDAAAPNALADAVDALFTSAAEKDAFAGAVVVVDEGREVLRKAYGPANRDTKAPNQPDTIFRIGSVSKQFTAAAVLALAAEGKLAVTDEASKYFPEYPPENLTKDGASVTLHHLLAHTSGIADPYATSFFAKAAWRRPIDPQELIDAAKSLPLTTKPGESFAYSNYGYLLLARIVEKVSGKTFEAYLKERFFAPLGMTDTGTRMPSSLAARAAVGYEKAKDGTFTSLADDPAFRDPDCTLAFGAGQVYSTVADLAKWDRALETDTALPAAQRALLFTPNLSDYAYGWVVEQKSGVTMQWHNGSLAPLGFTSLVVRVPSKQRFVAYLTNLDTQTIVPFEKKVEALVVR